MLTTGETTVQATAEMFQTSRTTLYRAMERAEEAAIAALAPQPRGRKGPSEEELKLRALTQQLEAKTAEVGQWETKYEVAQAFIELQRQALSGTTTGPAKESDPKKARRQRRRRAKRKKP